MTDREYIEAFVERNDQEAFAALVRRHAGMVYAAARRMLGTHAVHAEDVTQAVFLLLAQRAGRLLRRQDAAGWLHEATRYCCMDVLKGERRRRRHEQEVAMRRGEEAAAGGDAEMLMVLDEALGELGPRYRGALVSRYLENRTMGETAEALGVSVAAAEKRVERGLEKLRRMLVRRGVSSAVAAGVVGVMAAESAKAAPSGLVITGAGGAGAAGIAEGAAVMMKGATMKAIATAAAVVVVLGILGGMATAGLGRAKPSGTVAATAPAAGASAPAAIVAGPAAQVTYRGVVRDEAGKAVAGAKLQLERREWGEDGMRVEVETTSGADGRFVLGPVEYLPMFGYSFRQIVADGAGYAWGWKETRWYGKKAAVEEIRLSRPTVIAGAVMDEGGKPVAGAKVDLSVLRGPGFDWGDSMNFSAADGREVVTDGSGRFRFERVAEGTRAFVEVRSPGLADFRESSKHPDMGPPVAAGQTEVRIAMRRGGQVKVALMHGGQAYRKGKVRVVATAGTRVAGQAWTNEQGEAMFTGLEAGRYVFQAGGMGLSEGVVGGATEAIEVKAGETKSAAIACVKGRMLRGKLVGDERAAAHTHVTVMSVEANFLQFRGEADAEGRFEVALGKGKYWIAADALGGLARLRLDGEQSKRVEVAAGEGPIDLEMKLGDVWHGRLVDERGEGVAGFVSAWGTIETRADGRFELPVGGKTELATAWDKEQKRGCFFFHHDEGGEHRVVMEPMGEVAGRIDVPPGRKASEMRVVLSVNIGRQMWQGYSLPFVKTNVDEDGEFRISPVPVGHDEYYSGREGVNDPEGKMVQVGSEMWVDASLEGFDSVINPKFRPKPGGMVDVGTVKLFPRHEENADYTQRTGVVKGRVLDEKGGPVRGLRVQCGGEQGSKAITDMEGRFELTRLPVGEVQVWAQRREGYNQPVFKVSSPSEGLELRLYPPAWKWYGKKAPEVVVDRWVSGEIKGLCDLQGKVVLLAVGTYQKYEIDRLQKLQEEYGSKGVVVVVIHPHVAKKEKDGYDDPSLHEEDVVAMAKKTGLIVALDGSVIPAPAGSPVNASGRGATDVLYGAENCGTTEPMFVIDGKGILRGVVTTGNVAERLEEALKK